jgi:hypothetical protein
LACPAHNLLCVFQPSRGFGIFAYPASHCFVRGWARTVRSEKERAAVDYRYAPVYADDLCLIKFSGSVWVATSMINKRAPIDQVVDQCRSDPFILS